MSAEAVVRSQPFSASPVTLRVVSTPPTPARASMSHCWTPAVDYREKGEGAGGGASESGPEGTGGGITNVHPVGPMGENQARWDWEDK